MDGGVERVYRSHWCHIAISMVRSKRGLGKMRGVRDILRSEYGIFGLFCMIRRALGIELLGLKYQNELPTRSVPASMH